MDSNFNKNENIKVDIIEKPNENEHINESNLELDSIIKEIDETPINNYFFYNNILNEGVDLDFLSKSIVYDMNYNIKQLTRICEYYGISKDIKINKLKKDDIINILLDFEENPLNIDIVYKRQQLWYFMSELKNDNFMKKYIIW
jgi:hypothetical protein